MKRRLRHYGALALALVSFASRAHSQVPVPATTDAASGNTSDTQGGAVVVLALRGDALDTERLQALLESELGREVVLEPAASEVAREQIFGVVTFAYRREAGELAVAWDSGGQTVTRVVAAPSDPALLESDGAMLAANLARREVDDLLSARAAPMAPVPTTAPAMVAPVAAAAIAPAIADQLAEHRHATAGFFYPLATHYGHPEVTTSLDVNLVYGRVGAIDGGQLGGVNVVRREAGPPASMAGLQVGWIANIVDGSVRGLQFAPLFNQVSEDTRGAQLAFGANLAGGPIEGLQSAFFFNSAGKMSGLQLSLVNVAGDVDGLQIGLVNIADRVRGVSVGAINVADDVEGVPLAPFSVTRTGGVHPNVWAGSSGFGNVGVKFATRHTYTMLFGSYHHAFALDFVGGGFALGGSIELGGQFRFDIDLSATYLVSPTLSPDTDPGDPTGFNEQLLQPRLRWLLGYRVARHFGLFAGVSATGEVRSREGWDELDGRVGPEIVGGVEL